VTKQHAISCLLTNINKVQYEKFQQHTDTYGFLKSLEISAITNLLLSRNQANPPSLLTLANTKKMTIQTLPCITNIAALALSSKVQEFQTRAYVPKVTLATAKIELYSVGIRN